MEMEEMKKIMEKFGSLLDEWAEMYTNQIELAKELERRFIEFVPPRELKEDWRARLGSLQEKVDEMQRGAEELQEKFDELQDKLEGLLDKLEELSERLEGLQEMLE
jgi:chromosome segregation ATPase